jgi:uncharacterized protein DUF4190
MTNPGGGSSETPASDSNSSSSEPSSGAYEAPPIEQSQQQDDQAAPQPATEKFTPPTEQYVEPTQQFTPPGYAGAGVDTPPTGYPPATEFGQGGYPPPYPPSPAYPPPPPGFPSAGAQPPGYGSPYPDASGFGSQPGYGAQSYPPPPPYGGAPTGYPPPPSSYPAQGYAGGYGGGYGQPQPETNQLAIWSLVASLVGILCTLGSLVGIGLGIVALNQIKERRQGGHGLAIAGIAVGVATLIISVIWTVFALSA